MNKMTDSVPLILASGSPRRIHYLKNMGLTFEVQPASIDESVQEGESPEALVRRLSRMKAHAVAAAHPDTVVLGADTVVVIDNEILGKPRDREDAKAMILKLGGRTHQVYTAVCIVRGSQEQSFCTVTHVTFAPISEELAALYVASGESDDKSGSYAVQGIAAMFVDKVEGSVSSVVGLPASQTRQALEAYGIFPRTVKEQEHE